MTRWHIVDHRHLQRLAHLRRWHAVLLLAFGVTLGLMLDRFEGPVPAAQASSAPTAGNAETATQHWCSHGDGLQLSCELSARR